MSYRKCKYFFFAIILMASFSNAQVVGTNHSNYTRADTLRGSLRAERSNYDVLKYHLKLKTFPMNQLPACGQ